MLILSRENKESIIIDDRIEVKIVGIEGNTVKLAVKAPKEISIHRKEVYDAITDSNKEALLPKSKDKLPQVAKAAKKTRPPIPVA